MMYSTIYIHSNATLLHFLYIKVTWLGNPATKTTWENAADLPREMVKEYEDGLNRTIQEDMYTSGGQTLCVLSTALKPMQPEAKKPCLQAGFVDSSNSGYVNYLIQQFL